MPVAEKRAERLQVMLTLEEVEAVEEWRFANRMPSRSAAVRALMNLGLKRTQDVSDTSVPVDPGRASGDIGVIAGDPALNAAYEASQGPVCLVVHPDPLIGRGLGALLKEAGFQIAGPAEDSDAALILLREQRPVAAVLPLTQQVGDAKLSDRLVQAGVPLVFIADGAEPPTLDDRFPQAPVISRVSAPSALVAAVSQLTSAA